MSVSFKPVESEDELRELARLADEIWHEYWPAIIGDAQTDYMVENFQSLSAMQRGIAEQGYRYWFIVDDACEGGEANGAADGWSSQGIVGYTGGYAEPETNRFFVSKIYLLADARGHGYCSKTIGFYDELCRAEDLHAMYLTVNKHNELGIRAYLAKGFETIDSVETDIGNGFVMDDYIMEKQMS
ncbi:MAG: GNAT family N-acetyltransferase [Slackia sp.]|nr:GNAT family N-acetyltransferase [Slackia sp.]